MIQGVVEAKKFYSNEIDGRRWVFLSWAFGVCVVAFLFEDLDGIEKFATA
jgi:hypothetical protein